MAEPIHKTEAKDWMRIDTDDDDAQIEALLIAARSYCEDFQSRQYITDTIVEYRDQWDTVIQLSSPPLQSVTSIQYIDTDGVTQTLGASVYDVDITREPGEVRLAYNQTWPTLRDTPNAVTLTYVAGYSSVFTVAEGSETCTCSARTFTDTDKVRLYNSGGGLPGGLLEGTDYFIREQAANTFKLALTSGGAAVDITDSGTGTSYISDHASGIMPTKTRTAMLMLVSHWYEHREAYVEGRALQEVPMAVKSLLWQTRNIGMV